MKNDFCHEQVNKGTPETIERGNLYLMKSYWVLWASQKESFDETYLTIFIGMKKKAEWDWKGFDDNIGGDGEW
jgi:hypothetical protein